MTEAEWTTEELNEHHLQHEFRSLSDAMRDGNVRFETAGTMLMTRDKKPFVLEVPLKVLQGQSGALRDELNARLHCCIQDDPRCNCLMPFFEVGEQRHHLCDGMGLKPGMIVFVRYRWLDETSGEWQMDPDPPVLERIAPVQSQVDMTPSAAILRNENLYFDRKFDKISYILSEFLDNSLQAVVLAYFKLLKEAKSSGVTASLEKAKERRPWIRLSIIESVDGDWAFCVQDNGTGISHERLDSALRNKDPDMLLKETRLRSENDKLFFLDAMLSEYGVGLKQAGFFLANILKVVSKLGESNLENDVFDCVLDYHALEKARGQERFHPPKQPRKAGETFTAASERISEIERKFRWFSERLHREVQPKADGGLDWQTKTETGTAIMVFDLRIQRIGHTKKLTTDLLRDFDQIVSDLSGIYYWYACAQEEFSFGEDAMRLHAKPSGGEPASIMAVRPERQLSGDSRQAAGAPALSRNALTPKQIKDASLSRKHDRSGSARAGNPVPEVSSQKCLEPDKARPPLVNIEVEFVPQVGPRKLKSLSDFGRDRDNCLFEQALEDLTRHRHGSSCTPLQKVFHMMYREQVQDGFRIKWTATVVVCYCPFKQGRETLDELRNRFLEGQELQGFGDGCAYWHGKLVPGTRIGKLEWLESPTIIEAVLESTSHRGSPNVSQLKNRLVHATHRVVTRWFFNSRTLISDDKYLLRSFDTEHLKLKDSRGAADRRHAPNVNEVQHLLESTDLIKSSKKSSLIISEKMFETNLPDVSMVGESSSEIALQDLKAGSQPAETLVHNGDEVTLAAGLRKIYDFVIQASKHDEVVLVEVEIQRSKHIVTGAKFLGERYQVGSIVHFVGCQQVAERELFAGRIVAFRLRADPNKERDPKLHDMTSEELEQYKLRTLANNVALPESETVEVALLWLPEEKKDGKWILGRQDDKNWVPLEHVKRPDLSQSSESIPTTCNIKFHELKPLPEVLHWCEKPLAINLAETPDKPPPPVTAAYAMGDDPESDILYSASSNVHQALRHFLEIKAKRAEVRTHFFYVLRTDRPHLPSRTNAPNVKRSQSVKVDLPPSQSWREFWREGAFTFRAIPTCTLILRSRIAEGSLHSAVRATTDYLKSRTPLPQLKVLYHHSETSHQSEILKQVQLAYSNNPTPVKAGSTMASCWVQIHDQTGIPIRAMPFVTNTGTGLIMMRKLKLRRVQFVRIKRGAAITRTNTGSQQANGGRTSIAQPANSGRMQQKSRELGSEGEKEDDHGSWVPILGDSEGTQYKQENTWEFCKKTTHMATEKHFEPSIAASTFRVPQGFKESDGTQLGDRNVLYPFENTCLEYKVEIVAILSTAHLRSDPWASEGSASWKPQSSWSTVVSVEAGPPCQVKLVSQAFTGPYFLGEELPDVELVLTDGQHANNNSGNLIKWETAQLSKPQLNGSIEEFSAEGEQTVLRLIRSATKNCVLKPRNQAVELLAPCNGQPQAVSVTDACMKVSKMRLMPTHDAVKNQVFKPDRPTLCDITLSFDLGPGPRRQKELGRLEVLPGRPKTLSLVNGCRSSGTNFNAVAMKRDVYSVPRISIRVYDEFGLPTNKLPNSSCPSMTVTCMTREFELSGNCSNLFNNTDCRADFCQLTIKAFCRIPREGKRVMIRFEVEACETCSVSIWLPPPRDPDHFELLWNGISIDDTKCDNEDNACQLFVIEEKPGASITGLKLRVLSSLDEHLEGTQITLSTLATGKLISGEELPSQTNGSFGAEVVLDYEKRQERASVDVVAKATCKCVISLRPKVLVEDLQWALGFTAYPHLTVGRPWEDTFDLRVVDQSKSSFAASPRGLPSSIWSRLARPTIRFQCQGERTLGDVRIMTDQEGDKPAGRVVGKIGDYNVSVSTDASAVAEQIRPKQSFAYQVTLHTGDLDRFSVETSFDLIPDRCKLPSASIRLQLQDEGQNRIPTEKAHLHSIKAQSKSLVPAEIWARPLNDDPYHFYFEELSVVRKFAHNRVPDAHPAAYHSKPSLELDLDILRMKGQRSVRVLGSKSFQIGTGWQRSARIRTICGVDALDLTAGSVLPQISFSLKTDSGSALEGLAAYPTQLSVRCCPSSKGKEPQIYKELGDDGIILLSSEKFTTAGVYNLEIQYFEKRPEWDMLPLDEKTVAHSVRIKVSPNSADKFLIRPKPLGPLYQTSDRTRPLSNELYQLKKERNGHVPSAFNTRLLQVDACGNEVLGPFTVRLFLRKQEPSAQQQHRQDRRSIYYDFGNCVDSLEIGSTFVTKTFLTLPDAMTLVPDQVYDVSLNDEANDPDSTLFSFTFTTNARRDELLGVLSDFRRKFLEADYAVFVASKGSNKQRPVPDASAPRPVELLQEQLRTGLHSPCFRTIAGPKEPPQTCEDAKELLKSFSDELKALEGSLDNKRPTYPKPCAQRDLMSKLSRDGSLPDDFIGIVGELAMLAGDGAERKAVCLSSLLGRKLGYLMFESQQSGERAKAWRRPTYNVEQLPWKQRRPLPHLDPNQLKKDRRYQNQSNPEGWANGALSVLGRDPRDQQNKLKSFTRALSSPLDSMEFMTPPGHSKEDVIHLFSMLVSGYLFITEEDLAQQYAKVVKSCPALICLDTGRIFSQNQAAGEESVQRIDFNTPSLFLSKDVSQLLQRKWDVRQMRSTTVELQRALAVLDEKRKSLENIVGTWDDQLALLSELQTIEKAGNVFPRKLQELKELEEFFGSDRHHGNGNSGSGRSCGGFGSTDRSCKSGRSSSSKGASSSSADVSDLVTRHVGDRRPRDHSLPDAAQLHPQRRQRS